MSGGRVKMTCQNVPGVDSYNLYISKVPGAKISGEKILNLKNPYTISGLEIVETYYFVVTSVENGIESEASNEISHVVDK